MKPAKREKVLVRDAKPFKMYVKLYEAQTLNIPQFGKRTSIIMWRLRRLTEFLCSGTLFPGGGFQLPS